MAGAFGATETRDVFDNFMAKCAPTVRPDVGKAPFRTLEQMKMQQQHAAPNRLSEAAENYDLQKLAAQQGQSNDVVGPAPLGANQLQGKLNTVWEKLEFIEQMLAGTESGLFGPRPEPEATNAFHVPGVDASLDRINAKLEQICVATSRIAHYVGA